MYGARAWLFGSILVLSCAFLGEGDGLRAHVVPRRPGELRWLPAGPGVPVQVSPAWQGAGGAYCTFARFPKGFAESPHSHSADVTGIVVSGEYAVSEGREEDHVLEAGSYIEIPAGVQHTARCGSAAPCVIFMCQPATFDFVPGRN